MTFGDILWDHGKILRYLQLVDSSGITATSCGTFADILCDFWKIVQDFWAGSSRILERSHMILNYTDLKEIMANPGARQLDLSMTLQDLCKNLAKVMAVSCLDFVAILA